MENTPQLKGSPVVACMGTASATLTAAYIASTFLMFVLWRNFEPASTLQAAIILIYALVTLVAVRLSAAAETIPPVVAVPGILLIMLLYPALVGRAGFWATIPLLMFVAIVPIVKRRAFRQFGGWRTGAALAIGAFLGVVQFFAINGAGYAFVLGDSAIISGALHRDTSFHSAIVSMIANQGAVSTGVHGFTPLVYHVGVHHWMAALMMMAGSHVPLVLAMSMQLFVAPMILYFYLYAVQAGRSSVAMPFLLVMASLIVFLFAQRTYYFGFLASESYGLSLTIMFAALPIGLRWLSAKIVPTRAIIVEVLMAGVLVLAAGLIKSSTGYTLAAFFMASMFVLAFRSRPLLAVVGMTAFGAVGVTTCLLLYFFMFNPEIMPFYWWHFPSTREVFWQQTLGYSAVCLAVLAVLKIFAFQPLGAMFAVLFTVVVGSIPGALFEISGAGAIYFIHPAILIAITVTLAAFSEATSVRFRHEETPPVVAATLAAVVLLVTFGLFLPSLKRFDKRMEALQTTSNANMERLADMPFGGVDQPPALQQIADRIAAMAVGDRRALIYVPPDNIVLWQGPYRTCWEAAYTLPALTGLPMLAGVRGEEVGCTTTRNYGMHAYDDRALNRHLEPEEACREAQALGFDTVYSLDRGVEVTRLTCTGSGS